MANENFLSSVKIGGNEYDIYAKSALSAGWVHASAISGTIAESAITSVPANAVTAVNESAISSVNQSAISGVGWSAISSLAVTSESDTTAGIWTPSSTREYVTHYVADKITNVYKFKGSCNIAALPSTAEGGDVYDIKDDGPINSGTKHEDTVTKGDNVAWVTDDGGYWDKLANSISVTGKLDTSAFTAWSANANSDSVFSGTAKNAEVASIATNIGDPTHSAVGSDVIQSAWSGAAASAWVNTFTGGNGIDTSYLSGTGTTNSKLGLKTPESSIGATTESSALVNAGGISSFVDSNYIAKSDITVNTTTHQLVIDNT